MAFIFVQHSNGNKQGTKNVPKLLTPEALTEKLLGIVCEQIPDAILDGVICIRFPSYLNSPS